MLNQNQQIIDECNYLLKNYLAQYIGVYNQLTILERTMIDVVSYLKENPQKYSIIEKRIGKQAVKNFQRNNLQIQYLADIIKIIADKLVECLNFLLFSLFFFITLFFH